MSIHRWYEISCDSCGGAEHFGGNQQSAIRQAKEHGWIVTKGKFFCTTECKDNYNNSKILVSGFGIRGGTL